jgi:hypothetical protein
MAKVIAVLAAPMPWTKRQINSTGNDSATALARLATTNSATPNTTTGLRPNRSETGPHAAVGEIETAPG